MNGSSAAQEVLDSRCAEPRSGDETDDRAEAAFRREPHEQDVPLGRAEPAIEHRPAFVHLDGFANLVRQDFQRYEPSLGRMSEEWQENKKSLCIKKTSD